MNPNAYLLPLFATPRLPWAGGWNCGIASGGRLQYTGSHSGRLGVVE
jgi:hypothetical protein